MGPQHPSRVFDILDDFRVRRGKATGRRHCDRAGAHTHAPSQVGFLVEGAKDK